MKKTKLNQRWMAKDGCIFVGNTKEVKSEFQRWITVNESIAFNVGDDIAKHIVNLHNASLKVEESFADTGLKYVEACMEYSERIARGE
jgi:hypothetical protein